VGTGGAAIRSLAFLALVAACVLGLRWPNSIARVAYEPSSSGQLLGGFQFRPVQAHDRRVVYPYSVIPGGVMSAEELRQAAVHDAAIAQHYSGFDYQRARIVQVDQPRLVYLSYRRGDHIYWTRKPASLHEGETLLTDGSITARTRCGNRVSVLPQANTSPLEPNLADLDNPDAMASGMRALPSDFDSDLLDLDPAVPFMPAAGASSPGLGLAPALMPIPIGGGGRGGTAPHTPGCSGNCDAAPSSLAPPPPAPIPEPETLILVISGAATLLVRIRQKRPD
jgi:hypothetical protein